MPVIAYGLDALPADGDLTGLPWVDIPMGMRALRLNSDALPLGARSQMQLGDGDLFEAVRDQAVERCSPWANTPRRLLAWYFAEVARRLADHSGDLAPRLSATGGLYTVEDWRYSALKPLPRAFLPVGPGETVKVEVAVYRDGRWAALDSWGAEPTPKARRLKSEALAGAGIEVIDYGTGDLTPGNDALFGRIMGGVGLAFWEGDVLPTGPFAPAVHPPLTLP